MGSSPIALTNIKNRVCLFDRTIFVRTLVG